MNNTKKLIYLALLLSCISQPVHADFWSSTKESFSKAGDSYEKDGVLAALSSLTDSTKKAFSTSQKDDWRVNFLTGSGVLMCFVGFWGIIKGINTINDDKVSLLQQQHARSLNTTTRGILTTSIGLICAVLGVTLVATSEQIVNRIG